MCPRSRTTANTLTAAASALALTLLAVAPARLGAQSGAVTVTITIDADSVEILRAWRRQQGLDPPDAQADERLVELLRRRQAARAGATVAAPPVTYRAQGHQRRTGPARTATQATRDAPVQLAPRPRP